jgi:carboxypeptidase Taq
MNETTEKLLSRLNRLELERRAYSHAMNLLSYDAVTGAPAGGAANRGKTMAVLSEAAYELSAGDRTGELLKDLFEIKDELDEVKQRQLSELWREYEKTKKIPMDEYIAYTVLLNEASDVWHKAKEKSDYELFEPLLSRIVETNRRFAGYIDPSKQPYDVLLGEFERGLDMQRCDEFFSVLKERLVPLIHKIRDKEVQPDTSFLSLEYPVDKQRQLSDWLMQLIGIDRNYCTIGETEHPFTSNFNKRDVRITTHYYPSNLTSSMFSVIHEGGHALYELNVGDELEDTCLCGGVSMGIHESQSRLFENLIGRSLPFAEKVLPKLKELFPEQLGKVTAEEFYRAINKSEPSLIRIEADELTYALHVMIRYEIEKMLIQDGIDTKTLPQLWNQKVRDYLGIEVTDDAHGVLQDSHWSGGAIGYFPSYALGSAYGAQIMAKMKESIDVDAAVAAGDLSPVNKWLTERIWSKGCLYDPKELLEQCCEAPFDPTYFTDYLTEKYSKLYGIED